MPQNQIDHPETDHEPKTTPENRWPAHKLGQHISVRPQTRPRNSIIKNIVGHIDQTAKPNDPQRHIAYLIRQKPRNREQCHAKRQATAKKSRTNKTVTRAMPSPHAPTIIRSALLRNAAINKAAPKIRDPKYPAVRITKRLPPRVTARPPCAAVTDSSSI